jgi:hypothetical protein
VAAALDEPAPRWAPRPRAPGPGVTVTYGALRAYVVSRRTAANHSLAGLRRFSRLRAGAPAMICRMANRIESTFRR